jgi:hypothetical protein
VCIHLPASPAMISPACNAFLLLYDNCIARLAAVLTSTGAFFSAWCSAILQAQTQGGQDAELQPRHNSRCACAPNCSAAALLHYACCTAGWCSYEALPAAAALSGVIQWSHTDVRRVVHLHGVQC